MGGPYCAPYKGADAIKPETAKKAKPWFKTYLKDRLAEYLLPIHRRNEEVTIPVIFEVTNKIVDDWFGENVDDDKIISNLLVLSLFGLIDLLGENDLFEKTLDKNTIKLRKLLNPE